MGRVLRRFIRKTPFPRVFLTMFCSFLVVVFIPVFAYILLSTRSLGIISEEIERSASRSFEVIRKQIDHTLSYANALNYKVATDKTITGYLARARTRDYYTEYEIRNRLNSLIVPNDCVQYNYLYLYEYDYVLSNKSGVESQYFCSSNYGLDCADFRELLLSREDGALIVLPDVYAPFRSRCCVLRGIALAGRTTASVVTQIDADAIAAVISSSMRNESDRYLISAGTSVIATNFDDESALHLLGKLAEEPGAASYLAADGHEYRLMRSLSGIWKVTCVYAESESTASGSLAFARKYAYLMLCLCLVGSLLLCGWLARRNYRPVKRLLDACEITEGSGNEYRALEDTVQGYIHDNVALCRTVNETEMRARSLFLERIIAGQVGDYDSTRRMLRLYNIHFDEESFRLCVFVAASRGMLEDDSEVRDGLCRVLQDGVENRLPEGMRGYLLEIDRRYMVLVNGSRDLLSAASEGAYQHLQAAVEELLPCHCSFYVSPLCSGLQELPAAYGECVRRISEEERPDATGAPPRSDYVEGCISLIETRYSDCNLCVSYIADSLGISAAYISRYFKQQTGVGLLEYIHRFRIIAAKEILTAEPGAQVNDVARRVGFVNAATLIRVFKKIEGVTPGQYRIS